MMVQDIDLSVGRAHVRNIAIGKGVANDGQVQLLIAAVLQDRRSHGENRLELQCGGFSQAKLERGGLRDEQKQGSFIVNVGVTIPLTAGRLKSHSADITANWMGMHYLHANTGRGCHGLGD